MRTQTAQPDDTPVFTSGSLSKFANDLPHLESLRLGLGTFLSGDANELLAEKTALRSAELATTDHHLARLREGRPESIETSSLHLDVLRDLKRIHSHICSVAYPVPDAPGQLRSSVDAEPCLTL